MNEILEIFFNDLTLEAQTKYLEFYGIIDPKDLNADVFPLFVIEKE